MHTNLKPHISAAVKQLRGWVTFAALIVALCGLTQSLVFAFVQYTDVRFAEVRTVKVEKPLRVVAAPSAGEPAASEAGADHEVVAGVRGWRNDSKPTVIVARAKSFWDGVLSRSCGMACSVGVLSVTMLCVFCLLGVVVAGGGAIPGVERVVTAGAWSLMMGLLVVPWSDVMPSLNIPGIFAGYETMTHAVDAHQAAGGAILGSTAALMQWVAMPLVTAFVSIGVCLWFRAGVERGIIITTPSQLDRAVEREASALAKRGGAPSAPRSVGALNRAIGEPTGAPVSPLEQALATAAETADTLVEETAGGGSSEMAGKRGRSVVDANFRRLI